MEDEWFVSEVNENDVTIKNTPKIILTATIVSNRILPFFFTAIP